MRRLGTGLAFGAVGYVVAAMAAYFLILQFSTNLHDRQIEAAMTSAFVVGPVVAVVGFGVGIFVGASAAEPRNDSSKKSSDRG